MKHLAVITMLYDIFENFVVDTVTAFLQSKEGTTMQELIDEIPAQEDDIDNIVCAYMDERFVYNDSQRRFRWNWKR